MHEYYTINEACQTLGIPRALFDHHYKKNRFLVIESDRKHPKLISWLELKKLALHLRHGNHLLSDVEVFHDPEPEDFGDILPEA
jgi:hypothetical protein